MLNGRSLKRWRIQACRTKGQPPQDLYHGTIAPDGRVIESVIATGVCFCCKTAVTVDARGIIYAAWRHIFPGSIRDIAIARSTDGGRRFDSLVRVSEDKWELNGCPRTVRRWRSIRPGSIHIAWATSSTTANRRRHCSTRRLPMEKRFRRERDCLLPPCDTGHPQLALAS